jgi:hypothetical protein
MRRSGPAVETLPGRIPMKKLIFSFLLLVLASISSLGQTAEDYLNNSEEDKRDLMKIFRIMGKTNPREVGIGLKKIEKSFPLQRFPVQI